MSTTTMYHTDRAYAIIQYLLINISRYKRPKREGGLSGANVLSKGKG